MDEGDYQYPIVGTRKTLSEIEDVDLAFYGQLPLHYSWTFEQIMEASGKNGEGRKIKLIVIGANHSGGYSKAAATKNGSAGYPQFYNFTNATATVSPRIFNNNNSFTTLTVSIGYKQDEDSVTTPVTNEIDSNTVWIGAIQDQNDSSITYGCFVIKNSISISRNE